MAPEPRESTHPLQLSLTLEEADALLHLLMEAKPSVQVPAEMTDRLLFLVAAAHRRRSRHSVPEALAV